MRPPPVSSLQILSCFRRRYYLIGGTVLSLLGCIVAATAPNVPALIVGMALIGLGGSAQQSFSFVSNEIVPMKYRFIVNSWLYLWTLPTSAFGAAVSKAFILYTSAGWRWYDWSNFPPCQQLDLHLLTKGLGATTISSSSTLSPLSCTLPSISHQHSRRNMKIGARKWKPFECSTMSVLFCSSQAWSSLSLGFCGVDRFVESFSLHSLRPTG